jgi:tagatose 1,6-diphosphate aldolase
MDRYYQPPELIPELVDGDLMLRLREAAPSRPSERWAAGWTYDFVDVATGTKAGGIQLRFADTEELLFYGGHIGYDVDEGFRGRRFAARGVRLLLPIARQAGMTELWITCDPDNPASSRSIEIAGGEFVEVVDIPEYSRSHRKGRRQSCRYRFLLVANEI